ncbi:hypothetical protein GCM10012288_21730 [Malaciobacter pacificus]|uniref:Uncharacterized protein n=1 Tax=Malaciobacter pacificus TaxID=1080223 RepID=A0A5C2H736_9BACT|nr:hypothetical protein [Malaciobacter pacificus]QEP34129.1 hypothetical protein APAC_1002 [Malaciobacter pacificus]GGD47152.1 hypothetical protein GCM10012288_21730 [Malaciobacter pacificus]
MEFLLIILLVVGIVVAFFIKAKIAANKKSPAIKKSEIEDYYIEKMKEINLRYKKDEDLLKHEKLKFLKRVNQELSMNIFFDEDEAKDLLKKLTIME